jgi:bifunctional non-homologous end joining protein LigD
MTEQSEPVLRLGGAVITHPGKLFWPEDGLTKGELAQFYRRTAPFVLPWLRDRALTLERCPDGRHRACFFQKQAPAGLPPEIPTRRLPAPSARRDIDYIVGGSLRTLLAAVNLGSVALHVMNARVDAVDLPDWMAFDIDPARGMADAVQVALLLRERLEDHGVEAFVKTSGGRGLHVLVPLRRGATQELVRRYAQGIARELAEANPKLITVESRKARRRAPVYLDVMRNARAQTIVPPYSVRWRPHAPLSMPLEWKELTARLNPLAFTVRSAERRLAGHAPWDDFFRKRQTLPNV